jgi:hypothetical protein
MKNELELRVNPDGSIEGIYDDNLAEAIGAEVKEVRRASQVEYEDFQGRKGWTVRAAHDLHLCLRTVDGGPITVSREGTVCTFQTREEALEEEVKHFFELLET